MRIDPQGFIITVDIGKYGADVNLFIGIEVNQPDGSSIQAKRLVLANIIIRKQMGEFSIGAMVLKT